MCNVTPFFNCKDIPRIGANVNSYVVDFYATSDVKGIFKEYFSHRVLYSIQNARLSL
jgi:hypothetical protein